jgi:hypothetical protein
MYDQLFVFHLVNLSCHIYSFYHLSLSNPSFLKFRCSKLLRKSGIYVRGQYSVCLSISRLTKHFSGQAAEYGVVLPT